MANKKVSIYERLKRAGKWTIVAVEIPSRRKPDGSLYQKDDREGIFLLSWGEGSRRLYQNVLEQTLSAAVRDAELKRHYLLTLARGLKVEDPTVETTRLLLSLAVDEYIKQLTGRPTTKALHTHNLREFQRWTSTKYVEDINKAELLEFKKWLIAGGNTPYTASWKLLRINKFIKTVLRLRAGEGPIKKADVKEDLDDDNIPEIYDPADLQTFFGKCKAKEHLLFSTFLKSAFRKQEIMYMEWSDIDPKRRTLRVVRKDEYGFRPKNGKPRYVPIPQELMDRLVKHKEDANGHKLVFPTSNGNPDTKMFEKCQAVAKRAGLDHTQWGLHRFRATRATEWLRKGIDIATVRELLGHRGLTSVEHYLRNLRSDELVASGKLDD